MKTANTLRVPTKNKTVRLGDLEYRNIFKLEGNKYAKIGRFGKDNTEVIKSGQSKLTMIRNDIKVEDLGKPIPYNKYLESLGDKI